MMIYCFLFFILLQEYNSLICSKLETRDECLAQNECCFCENKYKEYKRSDCLTISNLENVKKFCNIFHKMNKNEGYTTIFCGSNKYFLDLSKK